MGSKNKLLLKIGKASLLQRTVQECLQVLVKEVLVVTGHESMQIKNEIEHLPVQTVHNENYLSGMHSSIKAGVKALRSDCDYFFICLADQPEFDHKVMKILLECCKKNPQHQIFAPTFEGRRGHPVLVSSKFIPEIIAKEDNDFGCSYLFQHSMLVHLQEVQSSSVLNDLDVLNDYEEIKAQDPVAEFQEKMLELRATGKPFAVATVIEVMGSASARTGSKALFDHHGTNLLGWVGGGCAERFIGEEAVKCLQNAKTNIVLADLDDEIFGLGVACGGKMRVFIEPILPLETIAVPVPARFSKEAEVLSRLYGWNLSPQESSEPLKSVAELMVAMGMAAATSRGRTGKSLREVKPVPATFKNSVSLRADENLKRATIVGRTRITEALARHLSLLSYSVRAIGPGLRKEDYPLNIECHCLSESYEDIHFREGEVVVIASHTAQDPQLVKLALDAKAAHVAMVGSLKRSDEVLTYLALKEQTIDLPLYVPAGLDIDAKNPEEIALSIVAEILTRELDYGS